MSPFKHLRASGLGIALSTLVVGASISGDCFTKGAFLYACIGTLFTGFLVAAFHAAASSLSAYSLLTVQSDVN
jgi:hypothetical protein